MAVNKGSTNTNKQADSNWQEGDAPANLTPRQLDSGLAGLFQSVALSSENRNLFEMGEIKEHLEDYFKNLDGNTTPAIQRQTIPTVNNLTPAISSILPGLVLARKVGDEMWVMGVQFSTREMTNASEPIRFGNNGGNGQQVSVPVPPVGYVNSEVMGNLRSHFERQGEAEGYKSVSLINMLLIDFEMLNHPEAGDPKDRPKKLATYIASQWETAVLTKAAILLSNRDKGELPSPFFDPKKPYGKDGFAEARINSVQDRVTKGLTLSAANMEVVVSTSTNSQNYNQQSMANSKEICRALAVVTLSGMPFDQHMANVNLMRRNGVDMYQALGAPGVYRDGYRPLQPFITLESAMAGEMMNYNQGLFPLFYSLYSLMATNADYLFTEVLRRNSVGQRGNLIAFEECINLLLQGQVVPQRLIMTEKTLNDVDFTNNWIRQNVSPRAVFRSNLVTNGNDSPVNNFLTGLSSESNDKEIKTMVAILSAMSNGKFAKLLLENEAEGKGWTTKKKALHRTPVFVINGLAAMPVSRKKLNTQEVDEMFLFAQKGKNPQEIRNLLNLQYGSGENDQRARCQRMRMEMETGLFDGDMHTNSFAQSCVWDPELMALIAKSMDSIGTLTVANNHASLRPNHAVFMPGGGLATYAHAGQGGVYAPVGGGYGGSFA